MAESGFNVTGLASGLDTASIISQLMAMERRPITLMQRRQTSLKKVDEAWGQINTKLSSLRTAIDSLKKPEKFAAHVATTSSNENVVKATKTGTPSTGSTTFTV